MYSKRSNYKPINYFVRVKIKFGKMITKNIPLNSIRIFGLKICGFDIGRQVYIGEDLIIASPVSEKSCNLVIGDRVAIGPRVNIILSSDANWSKLMDHLEYVKSTVTLEDDCWIGAGATILPGVTIGKCAIVGAGAVVTKNVQPWTVVAGVPAKKIKDIDRINYENTNRY